MAAINIDWNIIGQVTEMVRGFLPWQIRPMVTAWLVWSCILFLGGALLLAIHLIAREKPQIVWSFEKHGMPIQLSSSQDAAGKRTYRIDALHFPGENVSGHTIHQFDAVIFWKKTAAPTQLFAVLEGQWRPLSEIDNIPSDAYIYLGAQFRRAENGSYETTQNNGVSISPDEFLREFGAFDFKVTLDGREQVWTFTQDELRYQFDRQIKDQEARRLKDPSTRPVAKRRTMDSAR